MYSVGADLGGTKVSAVVVDPYGEVVGSSYRPHDGTASGAIASLAALMTDLISSAPGPVAVGVAAAGLVNRATGELLHSALLDLHGAPLAATLSKLVGVHVIIENDANATLLGIQSDTSQRETAILFALGTGVGGALSVGGRVIEGSFGFAAELGHVPVEQTGLHPCPCGSSGCLELFASGSAVAAQAKTLGLHVRHKNAVRAEDVVEAARAGDTSAVHILHSAGEAIGTVLTRLIPAFDPSVIYISGGFGHHAADFLVPAITERIAEQAPFPRARPAPRILADPVGPLAAAIGVGRLAQRRSAFPTHISERDSHEH
nr:ROK family protein [Mycolicibacterium sp. P9-64]